MIKKTTLPPFLRAAWYSSLICILGFFGILLFSSITETKSVTTKDSYFSFNPLTILDSISQDNLEEAFVLQPEGFEPDFDSPASAIKWEQNDFLQIAQSLHETVIGDSLDDWILQAVDFATSCEEIGYGPQHANLYYYKISRSLLLTTRYTESISINASAKYIRLKTETISPVWSEKKSIDLHNVEINVNDVLSLAEDNGGRETRKKVENNCQVSISLMPDIGIENWEISYWNNDFNLLNLTIDKTSGDVNKK